MTANDPQDIEKNLLSVSPKTAPPGLRARILESARKEQQDLVMTPRIWTGIAACVALIAVAVLGDAAVTRAQNDDLRALLNGRSASHVTAEESGPLPAEICGGISDLERAGLERMLLARPGSERASLREVFETRERLKGWLDHEDEGTESPD